VASPDLPGWYPLGGSGRRSWSGAKIAVLHPPKGSALAAPVTGLAAAPTAQAHAAYIALPAASAPAPATRPHLVGDNMIFSILRTYLRPQVRRRHDLSSLHGE
jgi:hypothetical protein